MREESGNERGRRQATRDGGRWGDGETGSPDQKEMQVEQKVEGE